MVSLLCEAIPDPKDARTESPSTIYVVANGKKSQKNLRIMAEKRKIQVLTEKSRHLECLASCPEYARDGSEKGFKITISFIYTKSYHAI
jgi:hypothetical protein